MGPIDDDHDCPLRPVVEEQARVIAEQAQKLEAVMQAMQALERRLLGPKSEKMPPVSRELAAAEPPEEAEARRLRGLARRREREALKQKLAHEVVVHRLRDEQRACPSCGGHAEALLGEGKRTTLYEYVPGYFVRQEHVQEKSACRCGAYIATADPPPRPIDKGRYGPGFVAHLITMKCADSIPLHRLAKQYQRLGIPMARSTLTDLFHAGAEKLAPLAGRLLERIRAADVVQADETSLKMQRPNQRGFVWGFLADELIAYRFAGSRSGETPIQVLGGSSGTLVVDAYTGYNRVTDVDGRNRAGCLAHVRRKFFDALGSAQNEARAAMDLILAVYRVEHEAKARQIVGTAEHLRMRQTDGRAAMQALRAWLDRERDTHPPKGPLGMAISYALNQWERLLPFLDDARIPPDNNASERALRVVALGRKNFMFVGDADKGQNLAGLYSLVATCELHEVDPVAYLKDVLMRIDAQQISRLDELLPHRWTPTIA